MIIQGGVKKTSTNDGYVKIEPLSNTRTTTKGTITRTIDLITKIETIVDSNTSSNYEKIF